MELLSLLGCLGADRLFVLLNLAHAGQSSGLQLAEVCGIGEKKVRHILGELTELGLIERVHRTAWRLTPGGVESLYSLFQVNITYPQPVDNLPSNGRGDRLGDPASNSNGHFDRLGFGSNGQNDRLELSPVRSNGQNDRLGKRRKISNGRHDRLGPSNGRGDRLGAPNDHDHDDDHRDHVQKEYDLQRLSSGSLSEPKRLQFMKRLGFHHAATFVRKLDEEQCMLCDAWLLYMEDYPAFRKGLDNAAGFLRHSVLNRVPPPLSENRALCSGCGFPLTSDGACLHCAGVIKR